jgi:excisionase family DNA binding protein
MSAELSPAQLADLADAIAERLAERLTAQSSLLDYSGLAEYLNCSIPHCERLKRTGEIPYISAGRRVLFDRAAVAEALSKKENGGCQ